jgi:hypothetical protein
VDSGAHAFCGDGQYVGDGGQALQVLWDANVWRELRGCPGRYVTPCASLRSLAPSSLLAATGCDPHRLVLVRCSGKDPIAVARLPGGGALLTYLKEERVGGRAGPAVEGDPGGGVTMLAPLFVHTLNTESGLLRKADALQLPVEVIFASAPAQHASAAAATLAILGFLVDKEKNASAYAMVRAFKRLLSSPSARPS